MPITALYAGLLTIVYLVLSARVIQARLAHRVSLGADGKRDLMIPIRAHANFAEYTVLFLLLMFFVEQSGSVGTWLIHLGGLAYTASRVLHAYALTTANFPMRRLSMSTTFIALALFALICVAGGLGLV